MLDAFINKKYIYAKVRSGQNNKQILLPSRDTEGAYEWYRNIKLMTMGAQAAQNFYNESLGCGVSESCPLFKTK